MTKQTETLTGIMFDPVTDDETREPRFPTVQEVCGWRANYLNLYRIDVKALGEWQVVAYEPRSLRYADDDREAMDETNWDALLGDLMGEEGAIFSRGWNVPDQYDIDDADYIVHAGYLLLNPAGEYAAENLETMLADHARLTDYPLLDESAYSEREYAAWQEYAPHAWSYEVREAQQDGHYGQDMLNALHQVDAASMVDELCQGLHYFGGFSGEYSPNFLDIMDAWLGDACPEYHAEAAARVRQMLNDAAAEHAATPAE